MENPDELMKFTVILWDFNVSYCGILWDIPSGNLIQQAI